MKSRTKSLIVVVSLAIVLGLLAVGITNTNALNLKKFDSIEAYKKVGKSKDNLLKYKKENKAKLAELVNKTGEQDEILVTVIPILYESDLI